MNFTKSLLFLGLVSIGTSAVSMTLNNNPVKENKEKTEDNIGDDEKHTHNKWHHKNEGKVIFYNKSIEHGSSSKEDNETGVITERVIAGEGAFSFRAYFDKTYKATCLDWSECDEMDIRYTIAGVSLTTSEVRATGALTYYPRMASIFAFYDDVNYSVGVPLNAAFGKYYDMYTLQEDTYRILLSKVRNKLLMDSTVELKVEVIGMKNKLPTKVVLAVGTIPLKITAASNNLQSLNCRCGKAGMKDEKVINDAIEAFEWQFNDVKKVYKVVLLDRDFSELSNTPYFKRNIASKGMWANFIYETKEGTMMMVKRYLFYKKNGDTFSTKATIGNHKYYLPVSPTCIM
jgi:hypothetical protein